MEQEELGAIPAAAALLNNPQVVNKGLSALSYIGVGVLGIAVTGGAYYLYKRNRAIKTKENGSLESDQAIMLHMSMKRGGEIKTPWYIPTIDIQLPDGTNEELAFSIAAKIRDWTKVQEYYRYIFSSSLVDDLRSDLSDEEYQNFMRLIRKSSGDSIRYTAGQTLYSAVSNVKLFKSSRLESVYEDSSDYEISDKIGVIRRVLNLELIENGVQKSKILYEVFQNGIFNDRIVYVFHESVLNSQKI